MLSIGNPVGPLTNLLGKEVIDSMGSAPLRYMGEEGEFFNVFRELGYGNPRTANLWYIVGNLASCRYHSKFMALRESPSHPSV